MVRDSQYLCRLYHTVALDSTHGSGISSKHSLSFVSIPKLSAGGSNSLPAFSPKQSASGGIGRFCDYGTSMRMQKPTSRCKAHWKKPHRTSFRLWKIRSYSQVTLISKSVIIELSGESWSKAFQWRSRIRDDGPLPAVVIAFELMMIPCTLLVLGHLDILCRMVDGGLPD